MDGWMDPPLLWFLSCCAAADTLWPLPCHAASLSCLLQGRFVKAGEAAVIVAAATSSGDVEGAAEPCTSTGTCL
jgi:hypothetical protein